MTWETASPSTGAANGDSGYPDISADGRFIVFASTAGDLVEPALEPGTSRVFLRDRVTATTTLVGGRDQVTRPARTSRPSLSANGAVVVYEATLPGAAPAIVLATSSGPLASSA